MAVTLSFIRNLNARNPNWHITMSTPHFEIDKKLYSNERVTIKGHPFYKETGRMATTLIFSAICSTIGFSRFVLSTILRRPSIVENTYGKYDVIVDLDVDGLNDYYHGQYEVLTCLLNGLFWKLLLKRPLMLIAASVGPLVMPTSRFMAKSVLERYYIITFREDYSKDYVRKLGITTPKMKVTADLAFSLAPVEKNKVDEIFRVEGIPSNKPIIGVCPSQFASKNAFPSIKEGKVKYTRYVELMAKFVSHLRNEFDAFVLLIPHSVDPRHDDRKLCREIQAGIGQDQHVRMIRGDYSADELKGVIGRCTLLASFLMHPTVQACSLGVPVVAPGYGRSTRVYGIIGRMMQQEKCIFNFEKLDFDEFFSELTQKTEYVWKNKSFIHEELIARAKVAKKLSLSNFDYIEKLLVKGF